MVDKFDATVFERAAHRDVIEDRKMLHVFAKTNTAGMRTDRYAKLCGHYQNGQHLVNAPETAAINLAKIQSFCLQKLLEHDAIMAGFAGCYADLFDRSCYGRRP